VLVLGRSQSSSHALRYRERQILHQLEALLGQSRYANKKDIRQRQEKLEEDIAASERLRQRVMAVADAALLAALAIPFWGFAPSPSSRLPGLVGARPAGSTETDPPVCSRTSP